MGIMVTYHGYNNPQYVYKNAGVPYTQQNMVIFEGLVLFNRRNNENYFYSIFLAVNVHDHVHSM